MIVTPDAAPCAPEFVGASESMREISRMIVKLGRCQAPVLLLGESGTGKEVVARAIHQVSNNGPFVPIDCSGFSAALMESELFGHVKGAFTGAVAHKIGLIEQAHGGIAFFDEIGEIPLELQSRLLRVLQEKEIRPVGSLTRKRADFRIVAATNRELAAEVRAGRFRQDLYFRLNVAKLRLPPLRDRREDIPLLAGHFLRRHGQGQSLSARLIDCMMSYDWPGNVRELENCIRGMLVLNSEQTLDIGHMPSGLQYHKQTEEIDRFMLADDEEDETLDRGPVRRIHRHSGFRLEDVEKNTILRALHEAAGDKAKAARMLGIGRTTLYRRLKAFGVD